ncbi:PAS domain S-box protein [Roseomonas nepalensis]|uniref:histidine kinase n=1 Tax=Muricoccus nepalensis TaxID=1854500 RepID=A0A502FAJ5_9PROT|nr:PAS domain-containing protein [Roseomonas nepalensis]TPG46438.1 PAS domain S-box protein [Roseomonas nepalensis]
MTAEDSLGSARSSLVDSSALATGLDFRQLFAASPAPLLVLSPDAPGFTILEVNNAYLTATMRTRDALVGHEVFAAFPNNPDDGSATGVANLRASLNRVLATRQPDAMAVQKYDILNSRGGFEERWWDPLNTPLLDETGRVVAIIHHVTDVTARTGAEAALRESEAHWHDVFERMGEGFEINEMILDPDGQAVDFVYVDANPAWERQSGLRREMVVGRRATEVFPGEETDFWIPLFGQVAATGEPEQIERYFAPAERWLEVIAFRLRSGRVAVLLRDVTERHRAEERQVFLSREVDHRAKNALSVVQAALRLTRAPDLASYIHAIEGRVGALVRAQTLLADDRWAGADLRTLLRGELTAFLDKGGGPRVSLRGPVIALPAGAAQPFAMAIHELATNAVKYGALSALDGQVVISWEVGPGPPDCLRLRWAEEGGPSVEGAPDRRGFGTRVLEGTVRGQLGGSILLTWQRSGLVCEIAMPLTQATQLRERQD